MVCLAFFDFVSVVERDTKFFATDTTVDGVASRRATISSSESDVGYSSSRIGCYSESLVSSTI